MQRMKNSGNVGNPAGKEDREEEMARSALSAFRAKEEEIERRKMEVKEKVHAQLGRVEEATKRLAEIREELEALADPMRKEVSFVRKKIDAVSRELKPLGQSCRKKEKEYKDALEAYNEKNRDKAQLVAKLMEIVSESEKQRMKKLEELSRHIDSLNVTQDSMHSLPTDSEVHQMDSSSALIIIESSQHSPNDVRSFTLSVCGFITTEGFFILCPVFCWLHR